MEMLEHEFKELRTALKNIRISLELAGASYPVKYDNSFYAGLSVSLAIFDSATLHLTDGCFPLQECGIPKERKLTGTSARGSLSVGSGISPENCQGTGVRARLDFFPEDVREVVIQAYLMGINGEKAPSDENGAKLQKERFEMLASNIKAGFEKLISC